MSKFINMDSNVITISSNEVLSTIGCVNLTDDIYDQIIKRLSAKPVIEYKCHNCGAPLELE